MTPTDDQIDLEFAYTAWEHSCRDPHPDMQECRRPTNHRGDHAAGFGANRRRWPRDDERKQTP